MDSAALADWLKNTIPGIVVLGAIGSILAAGVIWAVGRYLPPIARQGFNKLRMSVVKHFIGPSIRQAIELHFLETKNKVPLFYVFQLMKFSLGLFVSACCFAVFLFALSLPAETFLRASVLSSLMLSFLGIWYALRCLAIVAVPLFFDVEGHIERAKKEHLAKAGEPES